MRKTVSVAPMMDCTDKHEIYFLSLISKNVHLYNLKFKKLTERSLQKPTTIYGKSKLLGEQMLKRYCKNFIILRVSWLYSLQSRNFLTFILDNINKKNDYKMIYDAMSSPTSCNNLNKF